MDRLCSTRHLEKDKEEGPESPTPCQQDESEMLGNRCSVTHRKRCLCAHRKCEASILLVQKACERQSEGCQQPYPIKLKANLHDFLLCEMPKLHEGVTAAGEDESFVVRVEP